MFPCEWVKSHWGDRGKLLLTNDGKHLQYIQQGDIVGNLITYYHIDLSNAPCEWIKKYWANANPRCYPCEWIKEHWDEY